MRSALTASAACLVATFYFPALPARAQPDRPPPEKLTSRIEEYLTSSVKHAQFNGTVLLARDGQILFCRGYGMANLEHDVPCGPKLTLLQDNQYLKAAKTQPPVSPKPLGQTKNGPAALPVPPPATEAPGAAGAKP